MQKFRPYRSAMILVTAGLLLCAVNAFAAAPVDYVRDIKPIFAQHCYKCHGPKNQTHSFRIDQRAWVLRGGDSGEPTVKPGDAKGSHLIERLTSPDEKFRMPHDAAPLKAAQIDTIRRWIDAGALMPGDDTAVYEIKTDHWSFQPVRDVKPPKVNAPTNNPIDAFLLAKLESKNLSMSPAADRRTLIRRLYMVMHGLPPTPEQIDAFVQDTAADAYEKLVEQVLASPRYGERWAQHWLDVARYADTHGFEMNQPRSNAFHYRDWVVDALNADKPYDRFLFDQLAGDTNGNGAATGFIVAGAYDQVKGQDPKLNAMQRHDEMHDMISTTSGAMLGLTVGCARCHNHKFDPVTQTDYFRFQAVFSGVRHGDRSFRRPDSDTTERRERLAAVDRRLARIDRKIEDLGGAGQPINAVRNVDRFDPVTATAVRLTIFATNSGSQPCIDELEVWATPEGDDGVSTNVALTSVGSRATASSALPGYAIHKIPHLNDGEAGNDHSWISNTAGTGWARIDFAEAQRIDRVVWGRDRSGTYSDRIATSYLIEFRSEDDRWVAVSSSDDRAPGRWSAKQSPEDRETVAKFKTEARTLRAERSGLTREAIAYAGVLVAPPATHRLYRGDPFSPREPVAPGVIGVLGDIGLTAEASNVERRKKFARWVIDPKNPLTARVMANRIWQHHFGTGIVDTPSDFGGNGSDPTHPNLLDWLAAEFVRSGWSVKHMHRLILNSRAFAQSSAPLPGAVTVDGATRLLWRYPSRRIEGEAIRDAMLQAAGQLDLTAGGPGFSLFMPNDNYVRNYIPRTEWWPQQFRRMIYVHKVRMETGPVFGAFDCPDAGQSQPKRSRSTTAIQALSLFNSGFTLTAADHIAERIEREVSDDTDAQLDRLYRLVLGRRIDKPALRTLRPIVAEHGLPAAARIVFNTNEFLFIP